MFLDSLILSAADWSIFVEVHISRQDLMPRKCHFHQRQCFFFPHFALSLIAHERWVGDDKLLRGAVDYTAEEDNTCLFQIASTGRTQSGRLLDFAASSPAIKDRPALRCPETDDARNPNWPSTLFKSCIFNPCLQIYSTSTWQRVWRLLLAAEFMCRLTHTSEAVCCFLVLTLIDGSVEKLQKINAIMHYDKIFSGSYGSCLRPAL